jgi:hypothetical protein
LAGGYPRLCAQAGYGARASDRRMQRSSRMTASFQTKYEAGAPRSTATDICCRRASERHTAVHWLTGMILYPDTATNS